MKVDFVIQRVQQGQLKQQLKTKRSNSSFFVLGQNLIKLRQFVRAS